jgi:hypothetical protein
LAGPSYASVDGIECRAQGAQRDEGSTSVSG